MLCVLCTSTNTNLHTNMLHFNSYHVLCTCGKLCQSWVLAFLILKSDLEGIYIFFRLRSMCELSQIYFFETFKNLNRYSHLPPRDYIFCISRFIPDALPWREGRDELGLFGPGNDGWGYALHFTWKCHLFPCKDGDLNRLILGQSSLVSKYSGPHIDSQLHFPLGVAGGIGGGADILTTLFTPR